MKQQEHVMNERNIMMDTRSEFIVRLDEVFFFCNLKFCLFLDYIRRLKIENIYTCY
jgi:hypothetical protein